MAIQLTELRIGNLLKYTTSENDIVPTKIDWQDLKWMDEDYKGFNLVHDTIPLTEQWYIKFDYECLQELIVDMIHNAIHPISHNIGLWATTISGLKVHELQNLYLALTGKELTIKIK